jgi:predicted NUDIX family NTP pyrophosphohydrolase
MPKLSAGILLYRHIHSEYEILLVHPGGPFWAKKDTGAWSLPKGEYTEDEDAMVAAKREFAEETGQAPPTGNYTELGEVKYGNKTVRAWMAEGNMDVTKLRSNTFTMQWPPQSGKLQEFPEVDRAAWYPVAVARTKVVMGQVPLIDRAAAVLEVSTDDAQLTLL